MAFFHFIGIKGSGMSALAQILWDHGHEVQGSDVETYYFTQTPLEEKGIPIFKFDARNIQEDHTVIIGNAFDSSNEEVAYVLEKGIQHFYYHQYLDTLAHTTTSFAISGSHGKTSTTGLLSHALEGVGSTSYLIGDGTGKGNKDSTYFVFEACEYRRHFHSYHPDYAIITNIDYDHPDYFTDIQDVIGAFQTFANQARKGIILCGDDVYARNIMHDHRILYGVGEHNDLVASSIQVTKEGTSFQATFKGEELGRFRITQFGEHHVLNTLAVLASGIVLEDGVTEFSPTSIIRERLQSFPGVKRRFTESRVGGYILIDDYAHHPAEIKATIVSARAKYPEKKIIAIFQPHTFSRTKELLHEFSQCFTGSEAVYLCDIFSSARERVASSGITIHDLIQLTPNAKHLALEETDVLGEHKDSVLLFMGAGDVTSYRDAFLKKNKVYG